MYPSSLYNRHKRYTLPHRFAERRLLHDHFHQTKTSDQNPGYSNDFLKAKNQMDLPSSKGHFLHTNHGTIRFEA